MGDPQRFRVYKAEKIVPTGGCLPEVRDVEKYVAELIREPWFPVYFYKPPTILDGRRRRSGAANLFRWSISFPKFSRYERYVLHEVAHLIGRDRHGPKFCRAYVQLVEGVFGRHAAMMFEGSLKARRCEIAETIVKDRYVAGPRE